MRAAEFITEAPAKTNREHVSTMPPSLVYPDMDTGYEYYRFMTVVAAHPHHKAPHDHEHFRDHPMAAAYSPQEVDILNDAIKGLGHKSNWITKEKGREPDSNNKVSPVPHNSGKRIRK